MESMLKGYMAFMAVCLVGFLILMWWMAFDMRGHGGNDVVGFFVASFMTATVFVGGGVWLLTGHKSK